jgi:hypothetical protein
MWVSCGTHQLRRGRKGWDRLGNMSGAHRSNNGGLDRVQTDVGQMLDRNLRRGQNGGQNGVGRTQSAGPPTHMPCYCNDHGSTCWNTTHTHTTHYRRFVTLLAHICRTTCTTFHHKFDAGSGGLQVSHMQVIAVEFRIICCCLIHRSLAHLSCAHSYQPCPS